MRIPTIKLRKVKRHEKTNRGIGTGSRACVAGIRRGKDKLKL